MPYRQSQWRTDVTVGQIALGLADKWSGGESDSDGTVYPRASGDVQLGGKKTRSDGTATFLYDEVLHNVYKQIDQGAGVMACTIVRTPVGDDGTPFPGGALTLKGKVKGLSMPEGDYGSNDGAEVEITFTLDADLA